MSDPTLLFETASLLAVDIGASTTRAILFEVVEGQYRLIAMGQSPTTSEMPIRDIGEGARQAIENLQSILGRPLLDAEQQLIIPTQPDGAGIDAVVATISTGPVVRTVVAGLLSSVSLESAQRLSETICSSIVETLSLKDHRKPEEQIDSIIRVHPDLIIIAGGTDGGASRSIKKMVEVIGLACYLMPKNKRPVVLFAGNQNLEKEVHAALEPLSSSFHVSPNIRPSLEVEDLEPARKELARIFLEIRKRQIGGVEEVSQLSGDLIMPPAFGLGRIIRLLSQMYKPGKGILAADVGASAVTIAVGFDDKMALNVYPYLGLGENLPGILRFTSLDDIARWMPVDISRDFIQNYLYQKSLHPTSIPATKEDLMIEQSLARQALRLAFATAGKSYPTEVCFPGVHLRPMHDFIYAGGSVITNAPTFGQSLLLLLDGLQPAGITNFILDRNNLLPVLGAAADFNKTLPIQVIESGAFVNLAMVVSPVSNTRYGTVILRTRLIYADGKVTKSEVKHGGLVVLPLAVGQTAQLELHPIHQADVGFGSGRAGNINITGGALGVVIDARGRPLELPIDAQRRRELIKKWHWIMGG